MKGRFFYGTWVKIAAFLLAGFLAVLVIGSAFGLAYSVDDGVFFENFSFENSALCESAAYLLTDQLAEMCLAEDFSDLDYYFGHSGFAFTLYDRERNIVANTYDALHPENIAVWNSYVLTGGYSADIYVASPMEPGSSYYAYYWLYEFLFNFSHRFIWVLLISSVLFMVLLILLLVTACHQEPKDVPRLRGLNQVPLLIPIAFIIGFMVFVGYLPFTVEGSLMFSILYITAVLLTTCYLALGFLLTVTARLKCGMLLQTTAAYHLLRFLQKILVRFFRWLPGTWKTVLAYLLFLFFNILFLFIAIKRSMLLSLLLLVLMDAAALGYMMRYFAQLDRIEKSMQAVVSGDLTLKLETNDLRLGLGKMANHINSISEGMSAAVEDRMKNERFKTELITNVSHDLKTPLTSIVSYVDLLKKEDIENPQAQEYIEVLERQSAKLKKLTEDLVEAAKASSGVLKANMTELNLTELLEQSVAEYSERFERADITPVLNLGSEECMITADGRLLWRVFDNLLQNICKYAMPGTRVYIDVKQNGSHTAVIFKNVSAAELNITSDELMERFVQGDHSRHTEGSGLGLSIARSLTELQGGTFGIVLDGDLFKAIVTI